jgi:hypothetical protein
MAQVKVDPPPQTIPEKFRNEPQFSAYFTYLNKFNRDVWTRIGAGFDAIDGAASLTNDQELTGDNVFSGSVNFDGIVLQIDGIPVVGPQQAAIANVAAATATNPAAPTDFTAPSTGATPVTSNATDDLNLVAIGLQVLVDEVTTYEVAISALIVDVADIRTKLNTLLAELRTHGLIDT